MTERDDRSGPDYIVNIDPDEPSISGTWYDIRELREGLPFDRYATTNRFQKIYEPTTFIEVRSDGAVAQVWMPRRNP